MRTHIRQATERYRPWSDLYYYGRGKTALDPSYPEVARVLGDSPRPLLDIGCGMGLLASYLRAAGHRAPICGLDVDEKKIEVAQRVLAGEDCDFQVRSALDLPDHHGDVVMLDVMHYFSDDEQRQLLEAVASRVAPGGTALIRVTLRDRSWRYAVTQFEEWFVHYSKWIPAKGGNFPTREGIVGPLSGAGHSVEVRPMWGITPFNSYLVTLRGRLSDTLVPAA